MQSTTLYTAGCNGTTTGNGEHVLYRHQERLVGVTLRIRNIIVNGAHQLHDLIAPLAVGIFQSLQSGTLDNRAVIEAILLKLLYHFHFNQLKDIVIHVRAVALVQEYNDIGNAYLTSQKDMLLGLRHNAVGSSYNKNSAVHLSCAGDHVLYIVSMSRAVNVCIVPLVGLVLNVCGRNGNTTLSLFGSLIDILKIYLLITCNSFSQNPGNSSG